MKPYFNKYIKATLCLGLLFIVQSIFGQQFHVPVIDSSYNNNYYQFNPNNAYSKHGYLDTIRKTIKLPKVDFQMALFAGSAEINQLILKDTVLYTGKYINRKKADSYEDVCFFVLPKDLDEDSAELISYNISHQDFYIAPIIIRNEHLEFHKIKLYNDSRVSILTMIGFVGGCIVVFIFFGIMYFVNERKRNDYLYFSIYILAVIVHNSLQIDSYVRTYIVFPENPIWYHKLFEAQIVFNYFLFILFIRKFLQVDKLYPMIKNKMDFIMGIFLTISGIFFSTAVFTSNLAIIQNNLYFLFIICILCGVYLIYLFLKNIQNQYLVYTLIGSTILVLSSTIEFILARIYSETYHWNLQYSIWGGISPANFTQYGNWINIMFFAMMIGYKYHVTEKELLKFRNTKLDELEKKTSIEEYKIQELEQIQSFQSEQLFEKNKVFGTLQSQMGNVIQQFNPEFFENMVDAIDFNIKIGKEQEAKEQISLLKEFIGRILKYSNRSLIRMKEDIRNIEVFVKLDRYRLQNLFDFKLTVSPNINAPHLVSPAFFYQEYLEIVMWNHFDRSAKNNLLSIDIGIEADQVVATIIEFSDKELMIDKEEVLQAIDETQAKILRFISLEDYSIQYEIADDKKMATLILKVRTKMNLNTLENSRLF